MAMNFKETVKHLGYALDSKERNIAEAFFAAGLLANSLSERLEKFRPVIDCPKCGSIAHCLGGGPGFDGCRTCGNCDGLGSWETKKEWQAIHNRFHLNDPNKHQAEYVDKKDLLGE